jgi:hypothetical protein
MRGAVTMKKAAGRTFMLLLIEVETPGLPIECAGQCAKRILSYARGIHLSLAAVLLSARRLHLAANSFFAPVSRGGM